MKLEKFHLNNIVRGFEMRNIFAALSLIFGLSACEAQNTDNKSSEQSDTPTEVSSQFTEQSSEQSVAPTDEISSIFISCEIENEINSKRYYKIYMKSNPPIIAIYDNSLNSYIPGKFYLYHTLLDIGEVRLGDDQIDFNVPRLNSWIVFDRKLGEMRHYYAKNYQPTFGSCVKSDDMTLNVQKF